MEFAVTRYSSDINVITSRTSERFSSYEDAKKYVENIYFKPSETIEISIDSYAMSEYFWAKNIQPYCVRAIMFKREGEIWAYTIEEIESGSYSNMECESCKL